MRQPRISVVSILLAVAAVAIDYAMVRSLCDRPALLTDKVWILALGAVPMANFFTTGIVLLLRGRGINEVFLRGFVACGGLSLLVYCGLATESPRMIEHWTESVFDALCYLTGSDMSSPAWAALEDLGVPVLLLLPQLLIAVGGGWLASTVWRRPASRPAIDVTLRRLELRWLLVLVILVAAPAMAVEGVLRWTIDPSVARLEAGSIATVEVAGACGCWVGLPDRPAFILTNGARVRVEDDDEPSSVGTNPNTLAGPGPVVDWRWVKVTLLQGEGAGSETRLRRGDLKAAR